jgi:hypothetical protein
MNTVEEKLAMSMPRVKRAVINVLSKDPNYHGKFNLEIHCNNGVVCEIYEVQSRRQLKVK